MSQQQQVGASVYPVWRVTAGPCRFCLFMLFPPHGLCMWVHVGPVSWTFSLFLITISKHVVSASAKLQAGLGALGDLQLLFTQPMRFLCFFMFLHRTCDVTIGSQKLHVLYRPATLFSKIFGRGLPTDRHAPNKATMYFLLLASHREQHKWSCWRHH